MKNKERGSASIHIELRDEVITVYHGIDKDVLTEFIAYEGAWEEIWKGINNAKQI